MWHMVVVVVVMRGRRLHISWIERGLWCTMVMVMVLAYEGWQLMGSKR